MASFDTILEIIRCPDHRGTYSLLSTILAICEIVVEYYSQSLLWEWINCRHAIAKQAVMTGYELSRLQCTHPIWYATEHAAIDAL